MTGHYLGLDRRAFAAHNAGVPSDRQGDACDCPSCSGAAGDPQGTWLRRRPAPPQSCPPRRGGAALAAATERAAREHLSLDDENEREEPEGGA